MASVLSVKRVLGVAILLSVAALAFVIARSQIMEDPEVLLETLPKEIDLALQDLHYTHNEEGQKRWTLDADKAEYLRDDMLARLDNVRMSYYDVQSFGDLTLQSDSGLFDQEKRELDLVGQVVVTADNGGRFMTDSLRYSDSQKTLVTEGKVRIQSPRIDLTGVGMEVDLVQDRLKIHHAVKAVIQPEDKPLESR